MSPPKINENQDKTLGKRKCFYGCFLKAMVSSWHCMEWDLRFPKNYKRRMVQLRWSVGLGVGREVEREGLLSESGSGVCVQSQSGSAFRKLSWLDGEGLNMLAMVERPRGVV